MPDEVIQFPLPILTDRLLIREIRLGDCSILNGAIADSFELLQRWMPWARELPSVAETELFVRQAIADHVMGKNFNLTMWDRSRQQYVGSIGLHAINRKPREFEIGYWMQTALAGQGLMTESVMALTAAAFDAAKADRVRIRCDDRNAASSRVAEKAGYQFEGVMRHDAMDNDGNLRSTRVYARTRSS